MNSFSFTEHLFCIRRCAGAGALKRNNNKIFTTNSTIKVDKCSFMKLMLIIPIPDSLGTSSPEEMTVLKLKHCLFSI